MGFFGLFGKKQKKDKYDTDAPVIKKDPQEQYLKKEEPKAEEKKATSKISEIKPEQKTVEKKPAKKSTSASAKKTAARVAPTKSEPKKPSTQKNASPQDASESENIDLGTTESVTESRATRNGKFDIRRAKDGRFFFNLYASNHAVIASSQIYSSSQSAITGIKSVMANAAKAEIEDTTLKNPTAKPFPKWEIYIDKAGQYRFRLYASNGSCVCHSHGYAAKSGCKGGIDSIIRFASEDADINKTYLK